MRECASRKQNKVRNPSIFVIISLVIAVSLSMAVRAVDLDAPQNKLTVPNAEVLTLLKAENTLGTGYGSVDAQDKTITIKANSKEVNDCSGTTYNVSETTLTIGTNEPKVNVIYEDSNDGKEHTKELKQGEQWSISVGSAPDNTEEQTRILTIKTVEVVEAKTFNVTMLPPTPDDPAGYSGYMVNNQPFDSANNVIPVSNLVGLPLAITAQGGYGFGGWVMVSEDGTQELISGEAVFTFTPKADCTIQPVLAPAVTGEGVFKVGDQSYPTWNEAFKAAPKNGGVVVLDKDYELPNTLEGNQLPVTGGEFVKRLSDGTIQYIVPNGVTLLIPFDQAGTCHNEPTPKDLADGAYTKPTLFRKLSMPAGTRMIVESGGVINVGSRHSSVMPHVGAPSGPYGQIDMAENSSIVLNAASKLFAWGFITGSGTVTAEKNADVYEMFQIKDWRGGTATSAMNSYPVFPFSQWYAQNIETPLIVKAGGRETLLTTITAARQQAGAPMKFIDPDGGLFRNNSGSVTKYYDPKEDRIHIVVNGDRDIPNYIEPMVIKVSAFMLNITVDSGKYPLPLSNNITLHISSGKVNFNQDIGFLPGVQIIIDEGAEAELLPGKKFYFYDRTDWVDRPHQEDGSPGKYIKGGETFVPVSYSPSRPAPGPRTEEDLVDAIMDVNGVARINGTLYTTTGGIQDTTESKITQGVEGANIISSQKTGQIVITNVDTSPTASVQQCTQKDTAVTRWYIPVFSARLHNDAERYGETTKTGAYTETVANSTYRYDAVSGKWYTGRSVSFVVPLADYESYRRSNGGIDHPDALTAASTEGKQMVNQVKIQGKDYVILGIQSGAENDAVTLPTFPAIWKYNDIQVTGETTLGQITDASSGTGVVYGTLNGFYIKFKPNGGTGTMPGSENDDRGYFVPLNEPDATLSHVPQNQFTNGTTEFKGWKKDPNVGAADIAGDLPNNVTVNELRESLKPVAPTIDVGTEIVLYAHWLAPDAKNYTVEFGKLDYAYEPTYRWNPDTLKYEQSGQWNVIPDEGTSPAVPAGQINVINRGTGPITAQFSFQAEPNLVWLTPPGMTFMKDNAPGTSFPVENGLLTVNAMLTGTPPWGQPLNAIQAGRVTVTIQENTSP